MIKLTLLQTLIYSIPEAIVFTTMIFPLAGAELKWKKVILVAVPAALIIVQLRPHLGSMMMNAFVYYVLLIILLRLNKVAGLIESIAGTILAGAFYCALENINIRMHCVFFGINYESVLTDERIRYITFLTQLAVVIIFSVFLNKRKVSIFSKKDLAEQGDDNKKC